MLKILGEESFFKTLYILHYSLPHDNTSELTKMKAFSEDKVNVTQKLKSLSLIWQKTLWEKKKNGYPQCS